MGALFGGCLRSILLFVAVMAAALVAAGCGGDAGDEPADGASGPRQLDVGAVNLAREGLPVGFPADFPIYDGRISSAGKDVTEKHVYYRVKVITPDKVATIMKWYEKELPKAGYVLDNLDDVFADFGPPMSPAVYFHKDVPQGILGGSVSPETVHGTTTITIDAEVSITQ